MHLEDAPAPAWALPFRLQGRPRSWWSQGSSHGTVHTS